MEQETLELEPQVVMGKLLRSATFGEIIKALNKAQKVFKPILKETENAFFHSSYADLAAYIDATKDGLAENGLVVVQGAGYAVVGGAGRVEVTTLLAHSSNEWFEQTLGMPVSKNDAQGVGSAISYARRYARGAILDLAAQDDDANAAAGKKKSKGAHEDETDDDFDKRTEGQTRLKLFEIKAIDEACKRTGKSEAEIVVYLELSGVKPPRIENLLRDDFKKFLQWANSTGKPNGKEVAAAILEKPKNPNVVKSYQHAWTPLWVKAKERNLPEADVKQFYRENFNVEHGNELTPLQFKQVVEWVETA